MAETLEAMPVLRSHCRDFNRWLDCNNALIKSLEAIVTNTQETAEMFANEIADLASTERPHYFRFNVDQGLENIGLEEWREFETLTVATDAYLKAHRRDVDSCVEAFLGLIVDSIKIPPQGVLLSEFPLKTDQFFGRAAELSQISDYLEEASSTQKRVSIHGLPGSGKTQLALEYAMRTREHFHAHIWINTESTISIEQSFVTCVGIICSKYPAFRELATRLEPFDVVRAWLQRPSHYPWLMIIDGLDDLVCGKRLIQYCMGLVGGTFCVTSTHQNISAAFKIKTNAIIKLGPLKPVDSRSLFLCRAQNIGRDTDDEVDKAINAVVKSLDGFPLAIELAGVLVREGIVSLNDFPTTYKTQHQQLTKFTPGQGQWFLDKDYSLFHMFEMLYNSLSSKNDCAALLLTLCSVYGPWPAPISLFRNLNFFEASTGLEANFDSCMELRTLARDDATLRMAVYELHQGVLAIRKQNPTTGEVENISLHGSICRWRIAYLDNESRAKWTMQASYALASHFWDFCKGKETLHCARSDQKQSSSSQRVAFIEPSSFKVARLFTYPAERCIAAIKDHIPVHELAEDGRYAKPYFVTCFYMAHIFLGSEIEDTVRLLRGFAICCQQTGDLNAAKEALELALRVDSSLEQRMDDDALEIVSLLKAVRDRLAIDMDHQKRALVASLHSKQQPTRSVTQGEESYEESYRVLNRERDDQFELEIARNQWLSQRERCQAMYPKIVADCTLWMFRLRYLGDSIFQIDEKAVQTLAEIEMKLDQLLQESGDIHGSEHPDTISLVNLLGEFSSAQKKWPKAEAMLRRESEALSRTRGEHRSRKLIIHAMLAIEAPADELDKERDFPALEHYQPIPWRGYEEDPMIRYVLDRLTHFSKTGLYDEALQVASSIGDEKAVQILLDRGADANAQSEIYGNALQAASSRGNDKVVQMLLDRGADVNAQCGRNGTALLAASLEGNDKVVQMLLDRGADVNARIEMIWELNSLFP
ncbi:calcium-independent phospholipase [Penicillium expansum]|nr:calcium-independent phospholipase [Penicillium expansum]